jgi:hypothetical protein
MVFYDARNHWSTTTNSVATATRLLLSSIGLAVGHVENDQMRLDTVLAWQLAANDKNTGKKYILFGKGAWFDNHWRMVRGLLGWGNRSCQGAHPSLFCQDSCFICSALF